MTGNRRVRVHIDCERDLRVQVQRLPNATYDVYVGGLLRGRITTVKGAGQIEFDDHPAVNELPLTFDPFGNVAIQQGTKVYLAYPTCP